MKKVVWENKSNKQLCVTIPKNSGIKSGDIVNIEKQKIKKIVYSTMVGDMFHFGHLQHLENANSLGDFHICGVLTDNAVSKYRERPIANFEERKAIISNLRCIDMVVPQTDLDPEENLKKIHEEFPDAEIILVHGDNWDKIPGQDYLKEIDGKLIKLPYYKRLSDSHIKNIIKK